MQPTFRKIVIFGVGLIGGSFALALRKAGAVGEVVASEQNQRGPTS
jgi:prephenate dehydrogenase